MFATSRSFNNLPPAVGCKHPNADGRHGRGNSSQPSSLATAVACHSHARGFGVWLWLPMLRSQPAATPRGLHQWGHASPLMDRWASLSATSGSLDRSPWLGHCNPRYIARCEIKNQGVPTMAMKAKLWSLNGLATELGRDVRTLGKALSGVKPDGMVGKNPGYCIETAL